MNKNLNRFFSMLLAVLVVVSVSAAPLARRSAQSKYEIPGLSTPAAPRPATHLGKKGALLLPRSRASVQKSVFSSPVKASALSMNAPRKVAAVNDAVGLPQLLGSVIYSEDFSGVGLYTIPTNSSQEFTRLFRYANAEFGGVLVDDTYFTCEYYNNPWGGSAIYYTGYDMKTGKDYFEVRGNYYTYSMTYDPTTSTVYAIANIDGFYALAKIVFDVDQEAVIFDPIAAIDLDKFGMWNAIACDSHGQLWAVYSDFAEPQEGDEDLICTGSTLYKIDKTTAAVTKVGDTGYDSLYASDATFEWKTDRLFWTVYNTAGEGFLTEIDKTSGAATVLYVFPDNEEVTGLVVPVPEAEDGAPAAVTDLKANFTAGSLSGSVDFTAPSKLFDGSEGSGSLTYTVTANGEKVATGTTTFGANVSAPVTLSVAGFYTFIVSVSNNVGESPKSEITSYVGADTPEATTVTAEYANGVMTVNWLPVTSSINGGYIDVDGITYTVTRFPDKKVVANKISATTFSENLPEPAKLTTYYYEVVVNADNLSSEAARSNSVTIGSVVPPFTATFENGLDGFKVVDANGDGKTWSAIDGRARIIFNSSVDMDDWLISPGMKLTAGKIYDIAAEFACGDTDYSERIEFMVGTSADPESMKTVLLAPTDIVVPADAPMEWSDVFIPDTDGIYYFGFHGISEKNNFILYVDNFTITPAKTGDGPAALSDLTVTPGLNGVLTANVSFTTPSKTVSGKDLTALTKIELKRNGKVIKTWTAPAVNTPINYVDNLPSAGEYTYTVVSYSELSNGPETAATVYVGVDYPGPVLRVSAFQTDKDGEVTVTWDAVVATQDGAPLDPSLVQYQVCLIVDGSPVPFSGVIDGTTYTFQAVAPGKQEFFQFAVVSQTDRGMGKILNESLSDNIPVGTPYKGLTLSNQEDIDKYILGINGRGGGSWSVYDDMFLASQDGDNRVFAMYGPYEGNYGDLYTGLVSLEGMTNPGLTFYTFNIDIAPDDPDINEIAVGVRENGGEEFKTLETVVVSETGPVDSWNRVVVDLSAYAGKTIQVNFYSIVKAATYTIIDNIRIAPVYANDLAVTSVNAPEKVTTGDDYVVGVTVTNEGTAAVRTYNVELYNGKELIATKGGEALEGGLSADVAFDLTMSPFATSDLVLTAKVVLNGDENVANNAGKAVTVTPVASTLPTVNDLTAAIAEASVNLTWSEPDVTGIPADAVTEDFEDGLSFAPRYGEWIFVDKDNSPVDGFDNVDIPNIVEGVTKGSFWVWDTNTLGAGNKYYGAHSGSKYLFALYRADMGQSDEWAISPELNGSAQTISLYAKSYSGQYPEKLKLCYSTGSTDPDDFIVVKTIDRVPSDWTCYQVDVPEGAKYFAINSCASNSFMLMVDDITFIPEGAPVSVRLQGYDVYRNGEKITSAPVKDTKYTDINVENGSTYDYEVVTVYTKGQSLPSNVASVLYQGAGIDSVSNDVISIETTANSIVISGATGLSVAVYAVDGVSLYNGEGDAQTVVPVQKGVYLVKVGQTVKKVLVK